ncbi:hypothetical protein HJFPF1_02197 [Paramyrothecium foliicola]|nr:hypothetical protein HJFPF1_02197 [Paramyrothecium foliicola]
MFKSTCILALCATALALPSKPVSRQQCEMYATVSDPGFYAAASIPSSDFPNDPPYYENQILQWLPTNGGKTCTLYGNFERGFPVTATGNTAMTVYQRKSATKKTKIGSVQNFPLVDGEFDDIQSWPIGTFPCGSSVTLEFQLALKTPGAHASVTFFENFESGFFVMAC